MVLVLITVYAVVKDIIIATRPLRHGQAIFYIPVIDRRRQRERSKVVLVLMEHGIFVVMLRVGSLCTARVLPELGDLIPEAIIFIGVDNAVVRVQDIIVIVIKIDSDVSNEVNAALVVVTIMDIV